MAQVVAGWQKDGDLGGMFEAEEIPVGSVLDPCLQASRQGQAFLIGHAGEAMAVPKEEPGGTQIVGMGHEPKRIGAIHRTIDAGPPLFAGETRGAPQESEEDIGRSCSWHGP